MSHPTWADWTLSVHRAGWLKPAAALADGPRGPRYLADDLDLGL